MHFAILQGALRLDSAALANAACFCPGRNILFEVVESAQHLSPHVRFREIDTCTQTLQENGQMSAAVGEIAVHHDDDKTQSAAGQQLRERELACFRIVGRVRVSVSALGCLDRGCHRKVPEEGVGPGGRREGASGRALGGVVARAPHPAEHRR